MHYVVCVSNKGYAASLDPLKLYRVLPDDDAAKHDLIRVIDESGEDYLYPRKYFRAIEVPQSIRRAFRPVAP